MKPSKPGMAPAPKRAAGTRDTPAGQRLAEPTMMQHLFADPATYSDDEIKVWVRVDQPGHPADFTDALLKRLDISDLVAHQEEVIEVDAAAPLAPGQAFVLIRATNLRCVSVELLQVSPRRPELVFRGVAFTVCSRCPGYKGARLGDTRQLMVAARRASLEMGSRDWFGGMAEFATKFLQPPRRKPAAGTPAGRLAEPTMMQHLFADPATYTDDEIKVWVQVDEAGHDDEFWDALAEHLDVPGLSADNEEVLKTVDVAPLAPGQRFLYIQATNLRDIRVELCRASLRRPPFVFRGVTFIWYRQLFNHKGLRLGDTRQLGIAAKRALLETGGRDWFGGIAEFATRFLRPPRRKQVSH